MKAEGKTAGHNTNSSLAGARGMGGWGGDLHLSPPLERWLVCRGCGANFQTARQDHDGLCFICADEEEDR